MDSMQEKRKVLTGTEVDFKESTLRIGAHEARWHKREVGSYPENNIVASRQQ